MKLKKIEIILYKCPRCDFNTTVDLENCPACVDSGKAWVDKK